MNRYSKLPPRPTNPNKQGLFFVPLSPHESAEIDRPGGGSAATSNAPRGIECMTGTASLCAAFILRRIRIPGVNRGNFERIARITVWQLNPTGIIDCGHAHTAFIRQRKSAGNVWVGVTGSGRANFVVQMRAGIGQNGRQQGDLRMKTLNTFLSFGALLFAFGCSNPADDVARAEVAAGNTNTAAANTTEAKRYVFGPEGSKILFVGSKVTGSHDGGFNQFSGELFVGGDGKLLDSGNKVEIDTTSIWSDNDRLTGHLKSADFFDTEKYPAATFVSTDINQDGTNSTVKGNLTLHGHTKEISFPANIQVSDAAVEVKADFSINRFDFEMKYPGKADDLIRKEVVLKLNVRAEPAGSSDTNKVAGI